jgi:hypothetical protein
MSDLRPLKTIIFGKVLTSQVTKSVSYIIVIKRVIKCILGYRVKQVYTLVLQTLIKSHFPSRVTRRTRV